MERNYLEVGRSRVYYEAAGAGFPVVLVHGLSGSSRWWRRNVPALAARFRVYVIDLLGFGKNRRQGRFVLTEAADLLRAWLDRLGIEQAHLIGHSMGGFIAAELAADFPERVGRLVLVDAAAFPARQGYVRNAASLVHAARYMPPSFFPVLVTDALRAGPLTLLKAAGELLVSDLSTTCAEVQAPTLVVWGERDVVIPAAVGERLHACLPDARWVAVEGAGHNPMWDRPSVFNRIVLDFLTEAAA